MIRSQHIRPIACLFVVAVLLGAGCAYYNTFYNAEAAYREGMKLKGQNQDAQAKTKFDKAIEKSALVIKRWPKSQWVDQALLLVGLSYYEEGQYEKAIREFDQLSLAFPNSAFLPRGELYRGLSLLADKQFGTARLALDAVKQKYPKLADQAAYNLAKSFVDRSELERGADSLAAFIERFPKSDLHISAVKLLADVSFARKRYADAEKWYAAFARTSVDPKERALAKLKIAGCRYEQGKYDEAIVEVNDVLGRYSDLDDEANLLLGKALNQSGRQSDALATWLKVKGSTDLGAEAAFRIGKSREEAGQFDAARAYYDTAKTRRVDSDYGVLAVKRLALLDALAARTTGKKVGGDSLTPAEAMFLVAEVNNLNLGEYDKAIDLYQKVHDSFPGTDWGAKALFAKAWIMRNVKSDTAGADSLAKEEISEYSETEYADESRRWLGLPVPVREKKPEVKPETTAMAPPLPPAETAKVPGLPPLPSESLPADTGDFAARQGLAKAPHGNRAPGHVPERPGHGSGPQGPGEMPGVKPGTPEALKGTGGEKPAGAESQKRDTMQARVKPPPSGPTPGIGARVPGDTVPSAPKTDTTKPANPPVVHEPKPSARLQLEMAHFETDSWRVQAADSARLKADADSLKAHPDVKAVIVGNCDPRASEDYNQKLGLKRAQAVRDFLVAAGVDSGRISVRSDGKKRPISTMPEEYGLDRRAEFELH